MPTGIPWELVTGPAAALVMAILAIYQLWKEVKAAREELAALNREYQQFLQMLAEKAGKGGDNA